jgi:hypothetical protein
MDNILFIFVGILVVSYILLYLSGRYYLREGFQSLKLGTNEKVKTPDDFGKAAVEVYDKELRHQKTIEALEPIDTGVMRQPCIKKGRLIMEQNMDAPFVKRSIMDVDDYEYNLVFQGESDKQISKALYNKLQSQYPLDWSVQPPSSVHFQKGIRELEESFKDAPAQPTNENPYREISGASLTPPDTTVQEMEERKILQTYQPKHASDLTTYNLDDAQELISKIYNQKGLIPDVRRKDNNIYEIVGTRRKNEKVVYEGEEAPANREPVAASGEATITVPPTAVDTAAGLDPFFAPAESTRMNRWDYQKFTPGLERMFAPTYPTAEWT